MCGRFFDQTLLVLILLHDAASVVSAKSKGVGESSTHSALLSFVEGEVHLVVDVLIAVIFVVVDGGRNDIVLPNCNAILGKCKFRWLRNLPIHNEDTEYFTVQIEGIKVGPDFTINLTRTVIVQSSNKGSLKNGKYTINLNIRSEFIEGIESTSYVTLNVTSININGNILPVVGFIKS